MIACIALGVGSRELPDREIEFGSVTEIFGDRYPIGRASVCVGKDPGAQRP